MASRSYTVPARTPASRGYTRQSGKTNSSSKRKTTFSEVNTLGNDLTPGNKTSSSSKKRKLEAIDITATDDEADEVAAAAANAALARVAYISPSTKKKSRTGEPGEEKRLRVFRKKAPHSYMERLNRVRTQRMFLIDRDRKLSQDKTHEEEIFDIAGTTGNIYQVTISKQPRCTCPDGRTGSQCKHIVYVCYSTFQTTYDCWIC
jgi:SWIM zinc finger